LWDNSCSVFCIFQYWEQGAECSDIFETIVDLYFVFFSIGSSKVWYLWDNSWSVLCIFQHWEQGAEWSDIFETHKYQTLLLPILKNTQYRSPIVSKMSDHSAPCSQYWKIQSTDQLLSHKYQTLLLPMLKNTKYRSTIVSKMPDHSAPCSQYWKIQSTDQLSFQKWQTILLPASNTEK
jgi:hypothetical protein